MNLKINEDKRGKFMEVFHLLNDGQISYCTINPKETRGGHYHKRKKEIFCVLEGEAVIHLPGKRILVNGNEPELVEILTGEVHSIQNFGLRDVKFLIWCSEIFNPKDDDTFLPADVK